MIKIQWKSFTDYDLTLEIDDGSNSVTSMTPAAQPFVTDIDDDSDMFTPVRYQTGTIGIVGTLAQMAQIVGSYPFDRPVTLKASKNGTSLGVMWKGYVQSATYSQSWVSGNQELRIPVVSQIGLWEDKRQPYTNTYLSFAGIIKAAGDAVGGFDGYVFPNLINPATTLAYKVLMRNFTKLDESVTDYNVYIGDTYDVVIAEICKLFGLVCLEYKNLLCFVAPDYTGNYKMYSNANMERIDAGMSPSSPTTYLADTRTEDIKSADNTLSYLAGRRSVTVIGKVNPFDLELITVEGDKIPVGDMSSDSWGYEAYHPDTYFTKCFRTDQYAFMDVAGVGYEYNGHVNNPDVNQNLRFLNFMRKRVYNDEPYYGCSFVCERQYKGDTRIAVTGSFDEDTGWQYKALLRVNNNMMPQSAQYLLEPLVTLKSREHMNYSYLWCYTDSQTVTGSKYLSINGSVKKSSGVKIGDTWENATGYFYMKAGYGVDVLYSGYLRFYEGKFSGGTISNQYGSMAFDRRGFVIQLDNSQITERNAQLRVVIYAIAGGLEADMYYSIEDINVTIENRWTEIDAPMNESEENKSSEDTNHGWTEDYDVTCELTTAPDLTSRKLSAQFGKGVVLANDVMTENPHVLYSSKSAELALKDRLVAHYSDSKKKLEATVGMRSTDYGPLEPWQTHSPASNGSWAVLSQSIDWRDDVIQGKFFER